MATTNASPTRFVIRPSMQTAAAARLIGADGVHNGMARWRQGRLTGVKQHDLLKTWPSFTATCEILSLCPCVHSSYGSEVRGQLGSRAFCVSRAQMQSMLDKCSKCIRLA